MCRIVWIAAVAVLAAACGGGGGSSGGGGNGGGGGSTSLPPIGALQFGAASYSVSEGVAQASITVARTGGSRGAVSATLATSDAVATAGQDYTAASVAVSFADGDAAEKTVNISITSDANDEPDETVALTLSAPTGGATLGSPASATLTITDDDLPTFAIGGQLSGLVDGSSITLQDNGADDLVLSGNGAFTFGARVATGASFAVTIAAPPANPAQVCAVVNGAGVVANSDVQSIEVHCEPPPQPLVYRLNVTGQDDLYLINDDGSGLTTIASTSRNERFVAFAGDERVLFARQRNRQTDLYSVRLDGSNEVALAATTDNETPEFVTSEGVVIFSREAATSIDLYAINADGTGAATLANGPDDEHFAALTPGGRVIYEVDVGAQRDVYSVNLDGSTPVALADSADYEDYAGMTPDGRMLIELDQPLDEDLFIMNADGANRIALGQTAARESFAGVTAEGRIIFSRDTGGDSDLFAINADGTEEATLADSADLEEFAGVTAGGLVVFSRDVGGAQYDLYSIDPHGAASATPLATGAESEFFVAATRGGRVLFNRRFPTGQDLISIPENGGAEVQLAADFDRVLVDSATLVDDHLILFSLASSGSGVPSRDLFSIHSDGGARATLAAESADEQFEGVTDSRVIFTREASGQTDLYSIRFDGTDERVLANTPEDESLMPAP